jgi:anaerobic magnesium-protoporphyrin IX monomethyl ester cyclase
MKINRVLLISPPDTRPPDMLTDKVRIGLVAPLGLAYIAAVLEKDYEVSILDCTAEGQLSGLPYGTETRYGLTDQEIKERIIDFNPDLVGVSCLFSNKAWDAHNVCRIAKEYNKNVITVMGGAHPTALPEETLQDKNVDYVIQGEGELAFKELIESLNEGAKDIIQLSKTSLDLDTLPLPARHLLPMQKYLSGESPHSGLKQAPVASFTTSRGCPSRCEFCAIRTLYGDSFRMRSPVNVLSEVEHLVNTYHIKELHFEDDCLTANKKRALAIFQGIKKYNLSLNSPSGLAIFAMDEELIDAMKDAGYYSLSFAIESGSGYVRKVLMNKNVDIDKAERLIKYARKVGLKTKCFYILGYPGETKATMNETLECAKRLEADWSLFFPASPLPGTDLMERCKKNNWLADPNMDYRYMFFKSNVKTPEFDPAYVDYFRDYCNEIVNFKENPNLRLNPERARADFQEVLKNYPSLDIAQEALKKIEY